MSIALGKRVSYDQGCLKAVRKLPDYVSGKFLDVMSRYMDNPAANGLNLESVEGSKDKSLKSLRLDQSYRAIAFETATDIMFVHVNDHDKAYRWAEGRRVKLDNASNRIRIVIGSGFAARNAGDIARWLAYCCSGCLHWCSLNMPLCGSCITAAVGGGGRGGGGGGIVTGRV